MIRLIKRYGSRKLYDTEESRYVSLEELATWIREGQEIRVIDKTTSDDVTSQTLTQMIVEEGRRAGGRFFPADLLHSLIRGGGSLLSNSVEQIGQGVDRLLRAGADRLEPLRSVREDTRLLRHRLRELEASLERLERAEREKAPTEVAVDEPKAEEVRSNS